jgi:ribonuclease P protein component
MLAGLSRDERIRRRAEFQEVYERGTKLHSRYCTLFSLGRPGSPSRLGIAATRKLGGAVQRNLAKRLIREVFRRNKVANGFDIVVVPRRELLEASLAVLEADYRHLIERVTRQRSSPRRTGAAPDV